METPPKYEIFISYRRDGGVDYARMIYLELKGRGYNTFFDFNSLRSGKFNENIFKAIDECRYFILVLSNGALDRCVNEDDWVRHEIEYALSKGKEIIPVCPSGSQRGFPDTMPESFEPLRHVQISRLEMDDLFDKSFDKIVEDRFAADFREGRAPVAASDVVTVRSFKKIGIGVIAAIVFAAVVIGAFVTHGNAAAERRAAESRRISEEARERAEAQRKAAEEAKEKAREEALAAQREQIRLEAEAKAKAAAEEELRKAREEKARLAAEAEERAKAEKERKALEAAREKEREEALAAQREKIRLEAEAKAKAEAEEELRKEREEKARLAAEAEAHKKAEAERKELEEKMEKAREEALAAQREKIRLEEEAKATAKANAEIQREREARIRAEATVQGSSKDEARPTLLDDLAGQEQRLREQLSNASRRLVSLSNEVSRLHDLWLQNFDLEIGRQYAASEHQTEASLEEAMNEWGRLNAELSRIEETRQRLSSIGFAGDEITDEVKDIQALVEGVVKYRRKVESLGKNVRKDVYSAAKELEDVAMAALSNPKVAYPKLKDAEAAYRSILDGIIEQRIATIESKTESMKAGLRWNEQLKLLNELTSLDSRNERLNSKIEEVSEKANPSLAITPTIGGYPVDSARFFVDGKEADSPLYHVFEVADSSNIREHNGYKAIAVDISCVIGEKSYSYGSSFVPTWHGATNLVIELGEDPAAGTTIRMNLDEDTSIEMVWCPPGEDIVPYVDPETDEWKSVMTSIPRGFWISKTELTGRQVSAIYKQTFGQDNQNLVSSGEDLDLPVRAGLVELCHNLGIQSAEYYTTMPSFACINRMVFEVPTVGQWIHAALFGADKLSLSEENIADYAWCIDNSGEKKLFRGSQKKPNALGLYDMFGNVPEWTSGAAYEWLGLGQFDSEKVLATRLGGGCSDDYEGMMNFAKPSGEALPRTNWQYQKTAGLRLVGEAMFHRQSSIENFIEIKEALSSGNSSKIDQVKSRLCELQGVNGDELLFSAVVSELASAGCDIESLEVAKTATVRAKIVQTSTNETTLARYATEDPDPVIRKNAFKKLKNPSEMIIGKFISKLEFDPNDRYDNGDILVSAIRLTDSDACAFVATNSPNAAIRRVVIPKIDNSRVLKKIAMEDKDERCAFLAIQELKDRVVLSEIRKESKDKSIRAAARDRLAELSE